MPGACDANLGLRYTADMHICAWMSPADMTSVAPRSVEQSESTPLQLAVK